MRITYRGLGLGQGYTGASAFGAARYPSRAFAGGLGTFFTPTTQGQPGLDALNARIEQLVAMVQALQGQPASPENAAQQQRATGAIEQARSAQPAPGSPTPQPSPTAPPSAQPARPGVGQWQYGVNGLWFRDNGDGTFDVRQPSGAIARVNADGSPAAQAPVPAQQGAVRTPTPAPTGQPAAAGPTITTPQQNPALPPPGTPIDWITDPNIHGAENVQALAGAIYLGEDANGQPIARLANGQTVILAPEVFEGTPWQTTPQTPQAPAPGAPARQLPNTSTEPGVYAPPVQAEPSTAPAVAPGGVATDEGQITSGGQTVVPQPTAPPFTPPPPEPPQMQPAPAIAPGGIATDEGQITAGTQAGQAPAPEAPMFSDRYGNMVTLEQLLNQWQPMAQTPPYNGIPTDEGQLTSGISAPTPIAPPPPPPTGYATDEGQLTAGAGWASPMPVAPIPGPSQLTEF